MQSGRPLPPRVIPGRARLAHPLAWWIWAGGLAVAVSRLANPLLLLLAIGVVVVVVLNRRDPSAPGSLTVIGVVGLAAVVMRLVVSVVFGSGRYGPTVLVDAPVVPLPDWLGGIRLGGPITAEGLATAGVEGLRLAAILVVLAAANLLARLPGASAAIYGPARRKVLAETGGHYPAPLAALEVVEKGLAKPLDAALELETERFAQLALSPTAKNLIGLFFLKRTVEAEASSLARGAGPVSRLGVLGGGFMGIGIAQLAAHRGLSVVVKDRDQPSLERGLKQAAELFQPLVRRGRLTVPELRTAMTRLVPTLSARDFAGVDLVVEAVFEDLEVKHQVLRETEAALHPRAVFASNTSTLPIGRIAEASARPERVLGMHFFSPVAKMPLLEVIRHPGSDPEAVSRAVAAGEKLGKTVIVVEDGPGFFTTRVLAPLLNEAAWSLVEGASIEEIDRALKAWGWPVGPLTLLDEVGLDVGRHVQEVLRAAFGERMSPPEALARLLADGRSGRKSGRGFYRYDGGQKRVDESVYRLLDWQSRPQPAEDIADRCWLAMLNEAARAQAEGILTDPKAIDLAVIFGFGFPPFRGGILREADRRGLGWVVDRLDRLAERYGERLRPAPVLREMATPSKRFHQAG